MSFGNDKKWLGWVDIKKWAEEKGFKNLAKRMQLNNDWWMSSGEFGRNQRAICDNLFYAEDEEEAMEIAEELDKSFSENYGLY